MEAKRTDNVEGINIGSILLTNLLFIGDIVSCNITFKNNKVILTLAH